MRQTLDTRARRLYSSQAAQLVQKIQHHLPLHDFALFSQSNSLFFWNRELPPNHLKYRWLPREKTARPASKWPKFPVIHGCQPRPDSPKLTHPPPSLPNCGTAETGEIFRAFGGILQDQVAPETR